ncbi:MAG: hypothetical protein E6Q28_06225 [Afipia sp.]|nr:MAG: hypothetical protein E6Q28_06225 [Afipia sp.]
MIARNALLTFIALLLLIFGGMYFTGAIGWGAPALILCGGLAALIERRFYERRTGGRPGPEWRLTGESRIDPDTGQVIRVWVDSESGEKREVAGEPTLN